MERAFQQCVAEVAHRGAAVLLSSHILAEVEKLCDTVTIIRAGRTVQSGSLAQLRHLMRTNVTARTRGEAAEVRNWPGVHDARFRDGQVQFSVERDQLESTMVRLVTPASLEDLFLREYQGARP
jgi:ABC-2 type transport system ATP-binding protein